MGACGSRPMTMEDDAPMQLSAAKKTSVITLAVTPAEASATTEVTVKLSENKEEKQGKEARLVDLSERKTEEPKSEEVESEPIISPEETKGESKEETLNTGSITEEVAKESEEKVAVEAKPIQALDMQ